MPTGKDLKRLVRARMKKTGESYTAARAQLLNRKTSVARPAQAGRYAGAAFASVASGFSRTAVNPAAPVAVAPVAAAPVAVAPVAVAPVAVAPVASGFSRTAYAKIAGMSDAAVKNATGCTWERWVKALDKAGAAEKSHREIAKLVAFFGTPSWWTQMVTVGYERIRGLRAKGQQRGGGYRLTKSHTVNAPLAQVFAAFADPRRRRRWLDTTATIKSVSPKKRVHLAWDDGTSAIVGFYARGAGKSLVAVEHDKFNDKASADAMKKSWGLSLERLSAVLRQGRA